MEYSLSVIWNAFDKSDYFIHQYRKRRQTLLSVYNMEWFIPYPAPLHPHAINAFLCVPILRATAYRCSDTDPHVNSKDLPKNQPVVHASGQNLSSLFENSTDKDCNSLAIQRPSNPSSLPFHPFLDPPWLQMPSITLGTIEFFSSNLQPALFPQRNPAGNPPRFFY